MFPGSVVADQGSLDLRVAYYLGQSAVLEMVLLLFMLKVPALKDENALAGGLLIEQLVGIDRLVDRKSTRLNSSHG